MTIANILTISRVILSPLFFVFFFLGDWLGVHNIFFLAVTWILFLAIELSDLLDGHLARKLGETSSFGKIFDPFADSLSRLTYFLCFVGKGYMALWILLLILYRDLGVSFIRQIATKRGVTMGARPSGKIKAWVYAISGVMGMALVTVDQVRLHASVERIVRLGARTVFILSAVIAVASLIDYAWELLKTGHAGSKSSR